MNEEIPQAWAEGWYADPEDPKWQRFYDGTSWTEQRRLAPTRAWPPSPRTVIGGLAAAAVVTLAGLWINGYESGGGDGDQYLARAACRGYVEGRLKAPSTADYTSETMTDQAANRWLVTGTVDAENAFGVPIRNTYRCVVAWSEPATYTLIDLQLG